VRHRAVVELRRSTPRRRQFGAVALDLLESILRLLSGGLAAVGAAALAGIFVLVLAAVAMRYGWGRPFSFTEELSGLLMTVAVFTLLPATVLREAHIRVTLVSGRLRGLPARLLFVLAQGVLVAFCALFLREAWAISAFTAQLNLMSEQSRLPLAPFLYLSTVSVALAGVAGVWRALRPLAPSADAADVSNAADLPRRPPDAAKGPSR
jgi:TRAP-type C4-dicarboxylate transport system permease small subunit